MTLGLLILLFVAYQLWGTGIFTARAQNHLKNQFHQELQQVQRRQPGRSPSPTTQPGEARHAGTTTTTTSTRSCSVAPPEGDAHRRDHDPEDRRQLDRSSRACRSPTSRRARATTPARRCPARSATPRSPATARRTARRSAASTSSRPATTSSSRRSPARTPTSSTSSRSRCSPTDYGVVANTPDARAHAHELQPALLRRAAHRHQGEARAEAERRSRTQPPTRDQRQEGAAAAAASAAGDRPRRVESNSLVPSVLWGIIGALVGALWWWTFRRWRHPLTWVIGVVPFLVVLFPFYVYLERALPPATDGTSRASAFDPTASGSWWSGAPPAWARPRPSWPVTPAARSWSWTTPT